MSKNTSKRNEPFDGDTKHRKLDNNDDETKRQTNTNNRVQSKKKVSST